MVTVGTLQQILLKKGSKTFQWYMISSENYSLLDTLVWMGVHVSKLFSRAGSPIYEASVAA